MKRIGVIVFVLVLLLTFIGCGEKESENLESELESVLEETLEAVEEQAKQTGAQRVNSKERPDDGKTLQTYIDAYVEAGAEVEDIEFAHAKMIGAIEGKMLVYGVQAVNLYEFATEEEVQENIDNFTVVNGRFALNATDEEVMRIFESVE